ncbi:hypothetical protein LOK49_LG02G02875 [Camellia lanceoleosa]|uniref:Uncharacterized protein n=1 Tax=Camellia lanceoleosa TaxID=1840588 RepID=A0ACC0IMU3_9ERIC|nr:hypothetical protein LOK49_LG02G02875 [Camellia lanceoleosa]
MCVFPDQGSVLSAYTPPKHTPCEAHTATHIQQSKASKASLETPSDSPPTQNLNTNAKFTRSRITIGLERPIVRSLDLLIASLTLNSGLCIILRLLVRRRNREGHEARQAVSEPALGKI